MAAGVYRMRNLGQIGVIKDLPSYDLPENAFTDANNVRFFANKIEKMGGNMQVFKNGFPADTTPISICQRPNSKEIIYGTLDSIYRIDVNGNHVKASQLHESAPIHYTAAPENTWYYTYISNTLIMNTLKEAPQGLKPSQPNFEELPNWGVPSHSDATKKYWRTPLIRTYKDYLVCFGMYEGTDDQANTYYPQRLRWSDVTQHDLLPPNWHEDNPNTDGGFNDLTNAKGALVDGLPLQDKLMVYTEDETYMMELVGGVNVFQFRKVFGDVGMLAPECAVEFEGQHLVVTKNDVVVHNGNSYQSVASGKVRDYLFEEIGSTNPQATKCFVFPKRKEVWIQYVGPGYSSTKDDKVDPKSFACNKVAIYNYEFQTWSFTEIAASFDINMCVNINDTEKSWENFWEDATGGWDNKAHEDLKWIPNYSQSFRQQVLMSASKDQRIYALDVGYYFNYRMQVPTTTDQYKDISRPVVGFVERCSLDMDEMVEDIQRNKILTQIAPQLSGRGKIRFDIGGSHFPDEFPYWDEQFNFTIGQDDKVDCLANFRYPSYRMTDNGVGEWKVTTFDFSFITEGLI